MRRMKSLWGVESGASGEWRVRHPLPTLTLHSPLSVRSRAEGLELLVEVRLKLAEIVEVLPRRVGGNGLACLESREGHRHHLRAEPCELAALGLVGGSGSVGQCALGHRERRGTDQELRLYGGTDTVGEGEEAHRQPIVIARLRAVRRARERVPLRQGKLR